jgi:hypothetical protein
MPCGHFSPPRCLAVAKELSGVAAPLRAAVEAQPPSDVCLDALLEEERSLRSESNL